MWWYCCQLSVCYFHVHVVVLLLAVSLLLPCTCGGIVTQPSCVPVIQISTLGFETKSESLHVGEGYREVEGHNDRLKTLDGKGVVNDLLGRLHQPERENQKVLQACRQATGTAVTMLHVYSHKDQITTDY